MPADELRMRYWAALCTHLAGQGEGWGTYKPNSKNWMKIRTPQKFRRKGAHLAATALRAPQEIRANFVLEDFGSLPVFESLSAQRAALEREVGSDLLFVRRAENLEVGRIYARMAADYRHEASWLEQFAWLSATLSKLHSAFYTRVA